MTNILTSSFELERFVDKKDLADGYCLVRHLIKYKDGEALFTDFAIVHETADLSKLQPFEDLQQDSIEDCGYTATIFAFNMPVLLAAKENLQFDEIIDRKQPYKVPLEELWETGWDSSKYVLLRVNRACHRITGVGGISISRWVRFDKLNLYSITEYTHRLDDLYAFLKDKPGFRIEIEQRSTYKAVQDGIACIPGYNWDDERRSAPRYFNFWVYLDGETVDQIDKKVLKGIPESILNISEYEIEDTGGDEDEDDF